MWRKAVAISAALGVFGFATITTWIAFPYPADLLLKPPLRAWSADDGELSVASSTDFARLSRAFRSQTYRSFCGPATIATVLRAYGINDADQRSVLPSFGARLETFYTGMSLAELAALAKSAGLLAEPVYTDTLTAVGFRELIASNLQTPNDFILINYDRRTLGQSGGGHISAIGAYDEVHDAFLVLDQAEYKYPFTWVPSSALYAAALTRDGDRFRGLVIVQGLASRD